MRPGHLLGIVFAAAALFVALIGGGAIWALASAEAAANPRYAVLLGAGIILLMLALLAGAWAVLHVKLVRPIDAVTREIETLSHARQMRPVEIPGGRMTGGLVEALQTLIAKFIAARQHTDRTVRKAVERGETYQRRLEAILLDMSEGVIVCNLDNRILLYNQAAMQILRQPEALGLGRRLFGLFERAPILDVLDDLTRRQRADTKRKLQARRRVACRRRDGGTVLDARIALICSDEIETEGYVLTFTGPDEGSGDDADAALPPRPEFYDFDLFKREPERAATEIPLRELRCVAFDTETTGLQPSKGDELISIGAVRIVNGRIVRGETFEHLIDPGRKIPRSSTRFHGLTSKDVEGCPRAEEVLPRFHAFTGSAVLVAHNAAFDMKFLELKEKAAGVAFANPILDVLLLSAFLHDHAADHSLGATARRLGVDVTGRHTALGDAMTTAEIFLAMLGPLHDRGIIALGDALDISAKMSDIRKQQAKF